MSKSQLQPVTALPPKCHSLPNSHHCLSGRDILFLGTSVWGATSSIRGVTSEYWGRAWYQSQRPMFPSIGTYLPSSKSTKKKSPWKKIRNRYYFGQLTLFGGLVWCLWWEDGTPSAWFEGIEVKRQSFEDSHPDHQQAWGGGGQAEPPQEKKVAPGWAHPEKCHLGSNIPTLYSLYLSSDPQNTFHHFDLRILSSPYCKNNPLRLLST